MAVASPLPTGEFTQSNFIDVVGKIKASSSITDGGAVLNGNLTFQHPAEAVINISQDGSGLNTKRIVLGADEPFSNGAGLTAHGLNHATEPGVLVLYSLNVVGGDIRFVTGSAGRMRITNAGNVGIGTTSPQHTLHMGSGAHVTAGGVWTKILQKNLNS